MTQPAPRFQAQPLLKTSNQQAWLLLLMVIFAVLADLFQGNGNYLIAKNIVAGGFLAWLSQYIFARVALRHSGYQARKQIVHNFYKAQGIKWVVVMLGFTVIYLGVKPLQPLFVLSAFMLLQFAQIFLLYKKK